MYHPQDQHCQTRKCLRTVSYILSCRPESIIRGRREGFCRLQYSENLTVTELSASHNQPILNCMWNLKCNTNDLSSETIKTCQSMKGSKSVIQLEVFVLVRTGCEILRFINYDSVISHKHTHIHTHTHTSSCSHEERNSFRQRDTYRHAEEPPPVTTKAHSQTHRYVVTQRHGHAEGQKHGSKNRPRKTNPKTDRNTQTHKQKNRHQQHRNKCGKQGKQTQTHAGTPTHKQRAINTGKMRRAIHLYVCKAFVNKLLSAVATGTATCGLLLSDVGRKHLEQRTSRKLRHHFRP